jgi:hypothetical protein
MAPVDPGSTPAARAVIAPGLRAELALDPGLPRSLAGGTGSLVLGGPAGPVPAADPTVAPIARPSVAATPTRRPATRAASADRAYRGRNHVWSSAFGLDRSVVWFSCSRSRPPGMAVYRWGCAGARNIYLFAHAGGPFRRLHDLYVTGRLHRGMTVIYADAGARIHRFAVAWWRVVLPTAGDFAFAAQSRSSMTLQTCVGPASRYRLIVRLYETG